MRMGNLVLAYFVIGAMMWGGGVLTFEEAGVITAVVTTDDGRVAPAEAFANRIDQQNSIIGGVVSAFGGGLLIVWNLVKIIFDFIHWPIITLSENHAPPALTVLLGGGMTLSFYIAIAILVSRSS